MPVFTTALQGSASGLAFLSILSNGDSTTHRHQYSVSALTSPSLNFPCFARNSFPFKRFSVCIPKVTVSDDGGGITEVAEQIATSRTLKESPDDIQARRSADWKAATAYYERGIIYKGRIEGFNGGGLLVRFYFLIGFLPFPQLSPSHSCREPLKSIQDIAKDLVGSLIYVKVIRADEDSRQLIFSEKEAVWSKLSPQVNIADIFEGRVGSIEDYGAFVHLRFPDGFYHLTGLVHVSEISWDLIQDIRDILREGEEVRVKVVKVDWEKSRIALSIKQLEEDPLLETLDKVIPQNDLLGPDFSTASDDYDIEPLPGLETIMEELLLEDGIRDIRIRRQGFEKRVVSPDLQLWLSNAPAIGDQFTLLARAGRQVQEITMRTSLDQEGIKAALQRVLERVP